ncbi:OmpA family protein [Psychromonas sp. MB-3u-54]|uniref:OmpA family protein n=1 Tax=Psychromonas sp. MB-3u-54 TaxID=2058319 RepID=UPI000C31DC2D|nr:OmpA family protein [Psychromonas sp. MB-3u-54]PKH03948.1 OmpA family protein [Psychromonas sp. MB-3u-54]
MKSLITVFLAIFVSACTTQIVDMTHEPTPQKFDLSDSESDGVIQARDHCPDTFSGAQVDNNGCAIKKIEIAREKLLINFSNDSSVVRAEFFPEIEKAANLMKAQSNSLITIEGHTSKRGSAEYNLILSLQRAEAIKDILITKFAIDERRITAVGYGFERLSVEGDDESIAARNRRVVAEINSELSQNELKWTIYSVDSPTE